MTEESFLRSNLFTNGQHDLCLLQSYRDTVPGAIGGLGTRDHVTMSQQQLQPQQPSQSQLQQPPQQSQQFQQPPQQSQQGQLLGQGFSQSVSPDVIQAVLTLDRLETVAQFAKSQATQQGNHQVVKIADGLKEIAHLQKELIVEQNPLAQSMSRCTQQTIQDGIQQLQQYQQQPEVQELVQEAQQAPQEIQRATQQIPSAVGQQSMGQQPMGQQPMGQQWGGQRSTF